MDYINPVLKGKELWYFYADWCSYCKKQTPIVDEFEKENPDVTIIRLNSDRDKDAIEANNISGFPTFIPILNGEYLSPKNGLTEKDKLVEIFS